MGNYSKIIGSIVGGLFGVAVAQFGLPESFATPEIQTSVTVLFSAVATFLFPANKTG